MSPMLRRFLLAVFSLLSLACFAQQADLSSTYKLGAGDRISIRVLGESDLEVKGVRLSDAGTVIFPILGEIVVRGATPREVADRVADGLRGNYLVDPQVVVALDEYRNYYVNGYVARPGSYPFSPGMTVRKAITIAGGFRERAARDKLFIISDDDAKQKPRRVNMEAPVQPGDILTIEESFF